MFDVPALTVTRQRVHQRISRRRHESWMLLGDVTRGILGTPGLNCSLEGVRRHAQELNANATLQQLPLQHHEAESRIMALQRVRSM